MPWSGSTLTAAQRYHFVAGWMPWFGDALYGLFTAFALVWTFGLVTWPKHFDFPLTVFIASALGLFVFKTLKSFVLYGFQVRCSLLQNIGAAIAALSLTHTIGKAMLTGIFTSDRPFLRTPKWENRPAVLRGLAMAWEETSLMGLLWIAAATIIIANASESPEAWLWGAMLLGQSVPYSAALITAMVNVMPQIRARRAPRLSRHRRNKRCRARPPVESQRDAGGGRILRVASSQRFPSPRYDSGALLSGLILPPVTAPPIDGMLDAP